jgi:ectoine hydroxylase-related dioxygenase (phytanoyl-CoA dioxygenase family)
MENHKQIIKKFEDDGFYIAKNIIKEKQITSILENVCRVYFKNNPSSKFLKEKKPWCNDLFHEEIIKFRDENQNEFSEVYDICQSSIPLVQLITSKRISEICAILLHCQHIELSQIGNMVRMDTPNDTRNKTAWHQEMQFVRNPGLVLWIPLVEITDDIGMLHVLEKSHLDGEIVIERNEIHDYTTSRVSKCEIPEKILEKYKEKVIKINKGDALFFDTKLIHSSGDNTSKRIRFTCQTRFGNSLSNEFAAFRSGATYNPYAMKKLGRKIYD